MFLGGSGLATQYLFDEIKKGIDPLGSENMPSARSETVIYGFSTSTSVRNDIGFSLFA